MTKFEGMWNAMIVYPLGIGIFVRVGAVINNCSLPFCDIAERLYVAFVLGNKEKN